MSLRCPVCDTEIARTETGKPRSLQHHRRYFALIRAAFANWPDSYEFQPDDESHLRKWLQCKVGYYTTTRIDVPSSDKAIMDLVRLSAESAVAAAGGTAFIKPFGDVLIVYAPKSIAYDSLSHELFCQLHDAVGDVIYNVIGVEPEKLLREAEKVA